MQGFRDLTYTSTLGNPLSAMTQLQDIAMGFRYNGVSAQMKGLFGTKQVDAMKDFGLDKIEQDLAGSISATSRILDRALKVTGFSKLDRLGKNSIVNGALRAAMSKAKSPKKMAAFEKELRRTFGNETESVMADLRKIDPANKGSDVTENVKLYLFHKLADVQPISLSEMPKKYLDNPNGRIFYALKSFALKQVDILRREGWHKMKSKDLKTKYEGVEYLATYALLFSGSGALVKESKDAVRGKGFHIEDLPDNALDSVLSMVLASRWSASKFLSGDFEGAAMDTIMPPMQVLDAPFKDINDIANGKYDKYSGDMNVFDSNVSQAKPLSGKIAYMISLNSLFA